jgi:hypothetical protein
MKGSKQAELEQKQEAIRAKLLVISMIIDPSVRRSLLIELLHEAELLGVSIGLIQGLQGEINNIPAFSNASVNKDGFVIKPDQQKLYEVGNVLEAVCNLFSDSVSEKTKQSYLTKGMEFYNKVIDKKGELVQEMKTVDALTSKDLKYKCTKDSIDSLNSFLTNSETGKPTLDSAKEFDAACHKVAQEAKNGVKQWKDLKEHDKTALAALEATRTPAAKMIVAEKRIGVMTELKSFAKKADEMPKASPENHSIAFEILKAMNVGKNPDLAKKSGMSKLEALDQEISRKSLASAKGEARGK